MVRNCDKIDEDLLSEIIENPGITFSQLLELSGIPESTPRYRLMTLELAGAISLRKSRNSNAYYSGVRGDAIKRRKMIARARIKTRTL
ncbi:MAG: winged helix-turn-helix transcriptional regulator [Halobacteriota archaeon]